jgi:hypothetical protein
LMAWVLQKSIPNNPLTHSTIAHFKWKSTLLSLPLMEYLEIVWCGIRRKD